MKENISGDYCQMLNVSKLFTRRYGKATSVEFVKICSYLCRTLTDMLTEKVLIRSE